MYNCKTFDHIICYNQKKMEFILSYLKEIRFLVLEMSPWLLLGLIFAGLLKVYIPQRQIVKYLGKSDFKSSLNASLLGVPLPLCSCGVIPTAVSFYRNGASKGATNSFLISTPQTGIDSILATFSMLGWPFALLRPLVAFITGVTGGILTNLFVKEKETGSKFNFSGLKLAPNTGSTPKPVVFQYNKPVKESGTSRKNKLVGAAEYAFVELLQDIAKWLIIGFLVAALISVVLPRDFFTAFRGHGVLEILIVLAASVPIYICATGSIPIAAVLLMKGVSPGAALVFLMAGPATNVATISVLTKTMGKKSTLVYLLTISIGATIFGLLMNWFVPAEWILSKMPHHHSQEGHSMLPLWLQYLSSVLLIGSIVGGYMYSIVKKSSKMKKSEGVTVKVEGMSCSHCENTIKKHLEALSGIEEVIADNRSNTVKITGKSIDLNKIKETINGLGYKYEG